MQRLTLLLSTAAIVAGSGPQNPQTYTASGGATSMDTSLLWSPQGPPITGGSALPAATSVGVTGQSTVSAVPANANYDLGKISFQGDAAIAFLGGSGKITFGSTSGRSASNDATFAPPAQNSANTPAYDWNCNLNWRVGGAIPARPPCETDIAEFPAASSHYMSLYGTGGAAASVGTTGGISVSQCGTGNSLMAGPLATVFTGVCASSFLFPNANQGTGFTCPNPAISPKCAPAGVTNGVLSGTADDGNNYTVVMAGPYAGTVYQASGSTFEDVTSSVSLTVVTAASGATPGVYMIGATTFDSNNGVTLPSSSSSSSSVTSGNNLIILIIVVIAVLVIVAVALVVTKKKPAAPASGTKEAVAFENPMYDQPAPGESTVDNENNTEGGYMDVPADTGDAMYDDTAENNEDGTGGYMDVAGGEEEEGEDDF